MAFEKHCTDCGDVLVLKSTPAGNDLLAHYECPDRACPIGPIYTIIASSAYDEADATPVVEAMSDLATQIQADVKDIRGMLEFLEGFGKKKPEGGSGVA